MKLRFQERPWDLYLALGYAGVLGILIVVQDLGLIAAILLVLFVPGYVLVAALFPDEARIGWIERIALSLGLSIALVPLLGLFLNFTPFGIFLRPIVLSILAFTAVTGLVAYARRRRLPVERRLSATVNLAPLAWQEFSALERAVALALAASIIFAGFSLAYVIITPRGVPFTEFYILGPDIEGGGYPTDLKVSEAGTLIIGIVNHELERVAYTVTVDRVEAVQVWNETGRYNETMEVGTPTSMAWLNVTLNHDANWTQPLTFSIETPGDWKIRLDLFRGGEVATAYRNVHLLVTVSPA